jgi:hypothetical protein
MNTEIATIAYELYLKRGGIAGDSVTDWVTAERIYAERRRASSSAPATGTVAKSIGLREHTSVAGSEKATASMEPKKARKPVKTVAQKQPAAAKTAARKTTTVKPAADVPKGKAKKKN